MQLGKIVNKTVTLTAIFIASIALLAAARYLDHLGNKLEWIVAQATISTQTCTVYPKGTIFPLEQVGSQFQRTRNGISLGEELQGHLFFVDGVWGPFVVISLEEGGTLYLAQAIFLDIPAQCQQQLPYLILPEEWEL